MSKSFTFLIKLAKKGETHKLADALADTNININEVDPKTGRALIHIAIENLDIDTFNVIASQPGANLQLATSDGQLPLQISVRLNDVTFVNRLLELHVNARKKNKEGETAFHTAIRNQTSKDILKRLMAAKFDINQRIDYYGSYLNLAIVAGQPENFFFLIKELGIKYHTLDDEDNTSLILAVKHNRGDFVVAILQKLEEDQTLTPIEKQFYFNSQNKQGNTALHEACLKNYQTITHKLETIGINFGVDASMKNKKGQNIENIKAAFEKNRVNEIELEKRRQQERVVRKKQKQEEKVRLREQQERQRIEQKRKRKEEEERIAIQLKIKNQTQKQKTLWIAVIIVIILLGGMYLFLTNAINKKKAFQI